MADEVDNSKLASEELAGAGEAKGVAPVFVLTPKPVAGGEV